MPTMPIMTDRSGQTEAMKRFEDALASRYPMFKRSVPSVSCYDDWGLETGPGWTSLLIAFADKAISQGSTVTLHQVKEKFFAIRIYFVSVPSDHHDEQLEELASELEDRSALMCEVCSKQFAAPTDAQKCQHSTEEFIEYCNAAARQLMSH